MNNSFPLFSLNGLQIIDARVTKIYDGDTFTIQFPIKALFNNTSRGGGGDGGDDDDFTFRWKCRILGVDTPEIRKRAQKERALFVRDIVREKYLHQTVSFECGKFDKYGRVLIGNVIKTGDDETLEHFLLSNAYATVYPPPPPPPSPPRRLLEVVHASPQKMDILGCPVEAHEQENNERESHHI
jgi:endonuclease YncB( thermonuclease family)